MYGVILSTGAAQGLILGDDGIRYTFTPPHWRGGGEGPRADMRVTFQVQGSHAAEIYPMEAAATPPAPGYPPYQESGFIAPATGAVPGVAPGFQQAAAPTTSEGSGSLGRFQLAKIQEFGRRWWLWGLAGGGATLVLLAIVGAFALGIFPSFGTPAGKEIARHTLDGNTYILVEYGKELAIFSESGAPVGQQELAQGVLHSYAWRQVVADYDIAELRAISQRVEAVDDSVSDVRGYSNDVVSAIDRLEDIEADVPFLGSISAMDVVGESFPDVGDAVDLIRSLDSELNELGRNADSLTDASSRISEVEPSSVSGEEMEALFTDAANAARSLEETAGTVREYVSDVEDSVGGLAAALRAGGDTPIIGGALRDGARSLGNFESELSGMSSALGSLETDLGTLAQDLQGSLESADSIHGDDMERWLAVPHDAQWPPAGAGAAAVTAADAGAGVEPPAVGGPADQGAQQSAGDPAAIPEPTPRPNPKPEIDRPALVALYNATDGDNWRFKDNWLTDAPLGQWKGVTTDDDGRVIAIDLQRENMGVTGLVGEIPAELGNLTSLKELDLANNELTGEIPAELGSLTSLEILDFSNSGLTAEIPPEFGNLTNLKELDLSSNRLTGEIPPELGNLSNLEYLNLQGTGLTGRIPPELGKLSNLKSLWLGENELKGKIPPELGNLYNLETLLLELNNLSGPIPPELGYLPNLTWLSLTDNHFFGCISAELQDLERLERPYHMSYCER